MTDLVDALAFIAKAAEELDDEAERVSTEPDSGEEPEFVLRMAALRLKNFLADYR